MSPQHAEPSTTPLRLVTQRLSSTPSWQLPRLAPALARIISENGSLLGSTHNRSSSEVNVLMHKLKTQISTLLQDRSVHARWAAVVLVNATVSSGGLELMQGTDSWVRSLITILGKPDPLSTKKLCITSLTSIFLLTHRQQSLLREITTPALPGFLTACIKILSSKNYGSLSLGTVQALVELLPRHPSSFRPFITQIKACIRPLIAPTPSTETREYSDKHKNISEDLANSSRRLYALLSVCTPKKAEGEEWLISLASVIDQLHATANCVFRSLVEDQYLSFHKSALVVQSQTETIKSPKEDLLSLPGWSGIEAGIERLEGLLNLLKGFISSSVQFSVAMPVGNILGVLGRFLSLLAPVHLSQNSERVNAEIGRDERETLLRRLPAIHGTAIDVLACLSRRVELAGASFHAMPLQQCLWVLSVDKANAALRATTYAYVKQVLELYGLSMPRRFREGLSNCFYLSCEDNLPSGSLDHGASTETRKIQTNGNPHSDRVQDSTVSLADRKMNLRASVKGAELLSIACRYLPDDYMADSTRVQIDRTAILTQYQEVLLASALNPPSPAQQITAPRSMLPFLGRAFPECTGAEALRNPRMPIIQHMSSDKGTSPYTGHGTDTQDSDYANLYSGNGTIINSNLPERNSFVEDSMQSGQQLPNVSFASTSLQISKPVENTQRTDISLIEVPETQPISVLPSNKRDHDEAIAGIGISEPSGSMPQLERSLSGEAPSPKRLRSDEAGPIGGERSHADGTNGRGSLSTSQDMRPMAAASSDPITVPLQSTNTMPAPEEDSDSDNLSIHIDPTFSTDDEDQEEDEGV